jgi:hypothetical protein
MRMKVLDKVSGQLFEVYGIYWHEGKTYFYCFPKNSLGISSYGQDEVDVVDKVVGADFEYHLGSDGIPGLIHKHLLRDQLLDALLEHDPDAFRKFVSLLGRQP